MTATHGSLFTGIGGFDLGFERAGFRTTWQVERDPFCLRILASRFPDAERFNDVQTVGSGILRTVDVITAGVPCQDVSSAGKRTGLSGGRTGLFYEFARILFELRPAWFVFENVSGLFSSNRGRDLAEVFRIFMVECGYGICWRVLNSEFFGVPQRRNRLFIVGSFGRPCPASVLFESERGRGDFAPGGETQPDPATEINGGIEGTGRGADGPDAGSLADGARTVGSITAALGHHGYQLGQDCYTGYVQACQPFGTLNSGGNHGGFRTEPGEHLVVSGPPVDTGRSGTPARIPPRLDSARYRAIGNAVTVPVAEYIGRRLAAQIQKEAIP